MQAKNRLAKSLAVLVPLMFVAGCASQSEVSSLRSEVQDTRAAAEAAASEARAARVAADKAAAQAAAAERRAAAAEAAAGDVSTKADRMFRKSLRK